MCGGRKLKFGVMKMTDTEIFELGTLGMLCTRQGLNVLSNGLAGAQILFTRGAIGDGILEVENETQYRQLILEMSEMINHKMDLPIIECVNQGGGTAFIHFLKDNAELEKGFFAREIALYAIDQATGEEILYAYRNSGDMSSFIPANTGPVTKVIELSITTVIQNAPDVKAILDNSFAYVSQRKFDDHVNAEHPHPNIPNHYENVSTTNAFWVANSDTDLHLMNLSDTKKLLLTDLDNSVAENDSRLYQLELFNQAKRDLGLDPVNFLLIEDFGEPSFVDSVTVQITSYVKGGKIIGVASVAGLVIGKKYIISDDDSAQLVTIKNISYANGYYRVETEEALQFDFLDNVKFRRTTFFNTEDIDKRYFEWQPARGFTGISANEERELELDSAEIEGEGYIQDGYFSLWKE